jgi:hypothetical protein
MNRFVLLFALISLLVLGSSFEASSMEHEQSGELKNNVFLHKEMVDDLYTEFQIMNLASMKMKDPEGKTHHVMVMFMRDNEKITKADGKIKLIPPSGKE